MKVQHLFMNEAGKDEPLMVIDRTPQGVWYAVTLDQVIQYFDQWYGNHPDDDRIDPESEYFMFVPQHTNPWGYECVVVTLKDQQLRSVNWNEFTLVYEKDLQSFVKKLGVQSGEHMKGKLFIYKGDVYWWHKVFQVMPQIATVAGEPVYHVPKDAWWILRKLGYKYHPTSDQVLVVFYRPLGSNVCVSIKQGKITSITSVSKITKDQVTKISNELSSQLNLTRAETTAHYLLPNTKAHRMLQVIKDNPTVSRTDLYGKHLRLKQLPAYRSASDLVSALVSWGLVKESSGVRYEITAKGMLVLAALNADKKVPLSGLVKE